MSEVDLEKLKADKRKKKNKFMESGCVFTFLYCILETNNKILRGFL